MAIYLIEQGPQKDHNHNYFGLVLITIMSILFGIYFVIVG